MFRIVQRRPPVPVNIRGCENLPDEHKINLATWNVRTLYNSDDDDDFKLKSLIEEMKRLKVDILGVLRLTGRRRSKKPLKLRII